MPPPTAVTRQNSMHALRVKGDPDGGENEPLKETNVPYAERVYPPYQQHPQVVFLQPQGERMKKTCCCGWFTYDGCLCGCASFMVIIFILACFYAVIPGNKTHYPTPSPT